MKPEPFYEKFLSVPDLMRISDESESAWRKRLARGEIKFYKFGANVRIKPADFEVWLEANRGGSKC